jgi:hypothetical protein
MFDFLTEGENIYKIRAAISQPLKGSNKRWRGKCID